ncbi:MAG: Nif3-like dinuclear metal center hexameric protein [Bacteroidetes bacterium]|nr:Nif3-like dinuclear metal center hexameric protein [Bacteroidota bacterium]
MVTRREFLAQSGGGILLAGLHNKALTIQDVINLITEEIPGAPWEPTVDTVKSGDVTQPVRAVLTTFLATQRTIDYAARHGVNLIITHEPTYYNHLDETSWLENNPVYQKKRKTLEDNGIVVWRFHDYWHAHRPDGIATGVLKRLGWEAYAQPDQPQICQIPSVPLGELSRFMKDRFGAKRVRVMGSADMPCSRVGLLVGAVGGQRQIEMLSEVDVLVVGEVREWETTEYVRDANWQGERQVGLIVIGHALSEEPGMEWLAEWLTPRLPGTIVVHQESGDPFYFV